MKIDPSEHYGENYFYPNFTTYMDQYGVERKYYGPAKEWHGFHYIAEWIKENIPNIKSVFDIGCSAGSFVDHASSIGLECYGCDISKYAVKEAVQGARGKIRIADITKESPWTSCDLVTAMDLMEHIYMNKMDLAMKYIMDAMNCRGFFFACIATMRNKNEEFVHTSPEDEIPSDKRWLGVAGHVTIKPIQFWIDLMDKYGIAPRYDLMAKFQIWRVLHPDMKNCDSWSILNTYIGQKK